MKNKVIALVYLLVTYIPALIVVGQEILGYQLPAGGTDVFGLTAGFGLVFLTPLVLIRLARSK